MYIHISLHRKPRTDYMNSLSLTAMTKKQIGVIFRLLSLDTPESFEKRSKISISPFCVLYSENNTLKKEGGI